MSKRDNPVKTYLDDEEKAQLVEWADETGKSQAELLREAVLEYLDHDRTARIEGQVRELSGKVDDILAHLDADTSHTHTQQSDSLVTAREIIRRLQRNHDEVIRDGDVTTAIEDYAGTDPRTIRKYKRLFRKRGLLFEHPGDQPLWTTETETWGEWVNQYAALNGGRDAAEDVVEAYPAGIYGTADGYELEIEKTA